MHCTFSSSRQTSAWLFKRSGPCLTGKGQCCQEAGGLEGYGPSDGSQDWQNRGKIICVPQMWSPWGKTGRAGTVREPCPSSTPVTEEQWRQGCPVLLSFTNPSGLGSGKPAPWNWFNVRKRASLPYGRGWEPHCDSSCYSTTGEAAEASVPSLPTVPCIKPGPQLSFSPLSLIPQCNSSVFPCMSLCSSHFLGFVSKWPSFYPLQPLP